MTVSSVAHDLIVSAIDLTRACTEQELYTQWLALHSDALHGSAGIANYLASAALAFEEQAHPQYFAPFDVFVARENLSDLLMASAPFSCEELRVGVGAAIREAKEDQAPTFQSAQPHCHELYGYSGNGDGVAK